MKIYPCLRLIWGALLAAALLNLTALSDSMPVLVAANILNLCCYGVIAYALYRLSDQSRLLARAFPTCLASAFQSPFRPKSCYARLRLFFAVGLWKIKINPCLLIKS